MEPLQAGAYSGLTGRGSRRYLQLHGVADIADLDNPADAVAGRCKGRNTQREGEIDVILLESSVVDAQAGRRVEGSALGAHAALV